MIDHPADRVPAGHTGWTRFLDAIYAADPGDEAEWVEFKANLDPAAKPGRAALAKAIVAFANRDPDRALRWMDGAAVILVGLEPGSVVGATSVDPADLHNGISALIAAPVPAWHHEHISYRGKNVLALIVAPPRPGDPIACFGKTTVGSDDGAIYVRRPGKSEPANSVDIRRLTSRAHPLTPARVLDIDIDVALGSAPVPALTRHRDWFGHYLETERNRLRIPGPDPRSPATGSQGGVKTSYLANLESITRAAEVVVRATTQPENRSPDEYQDQVDAYLRGLRAARHRVEDAVLRLCAVPVEVSVTNPSDRTIDAVEVRLHLPVGVHVYDEPAQDHNDEDTIAALLPDPPRRWGPRHVAAYDGHRYLSHLTTRARAPLPHIGDFSFVQIVPATGLAGPGVIYPSTDIRPHQTNMLEPIWLVSDQPDTAGTRLRIDWSATSTNIDGVQTGTLTIPTTPKTVDSIDLMPNHAT